jgi:hypothetical protein
MCEVKMLTRIVIELEAEERNALSRWAETDLRNIRDQARIILRNEMVRRGLLEAKGKKGSSKGNQEKPHKGDCNG